MNEAVSALPQELTLENLPEILREKHRAIQEKERAIGELEAKARTAGKSSLARIRFGEQNPYPTYPQLSINFTTAIEVERPGADGSEGNALTLYCHKNVPHMQEVGLERVELVVAPKLKAGQKEIKPCIVKAYDAGGFALISDCNSGAAIYLNNDGKPEMFGKKESGSDKPGKVVVLDEEEWAKRKDMVALLLETLDRWLSDLDQAIGEAEQVRLPDHEAAQLDGDLMTNRERLSDLF